MTLDSLPDLEYKRVVSCKDSFHATDVLAVSEHGAPGRRPNIHTHCRPAPPRQTEALSSRTSRSRPWKRRSQAVRERKTSVLRACRVPNPAKRLNVMQRPKTLFEPQRSMTSRSDVQGDGNVVPDASASSSLPAASLYSLLPSSRS